MKKIFVFCSLLVILTSCKKETNSHVKDVSNDSVAINKSEIDVAAIPENCYMQITDKDTVFVKVSDNLGTITGKIRYRNFQKDSSVGDISGFADGDTLKLDYTYQSEGTTSTREIWFLMKDGNLLEGIGNYDETGERYKNPIDIKYKGGHTLKPADCKGFDKNF